MPLLFYKFLHLISIMGIFASVTALFVMAPTSKLRKLASILHGVFWLILFVSGFGLLAKYNLTPLHPWALAKLLILIFFGAAPTLAKKGILKEAVGIAVILAVGALAAYLGVYRPYLYPGSPG